MCSCSIELRNVPFNSWGTGHGWRVLEKTVLESLLIREIADFFCHPSCPRDVSSLLRGVVSLRLLLSDRPRFVMCIRWWTLVNIPFVGTAMSFEQTNLLHLFTCWLLVYIWFLHVLWCEKLCGLKLNGAWGSCAGSKYHTSSVLEVREEAGLEAVNIYALTGDHHCNFW